MLHSVKEERGRHFKLALRAGIPILVLASLLFYTTFFKDNLAVPTLENIFLMGGLIFVSIYFIFFLLELDARESLLDQTTKSYNYESFLRAISRHKPKTVAMIHLNNLSTINENYGTIDTNGLLRALVFKLDHFLRTHHVKENWIGRNHGAEFLIALNLDTDTSRKLIEAFTKSNQTIDGIEVDYRFSIIDHHGTEPKKTITLLRDSLFSQEIKPERENSEIRDADELTKLEKLTINALENDSLNLYFRPLYNTKKREIDSYEISTKLRTEEGRDILPRDYLPIVNRLGLGRKYDLSIFRHIVKISQLTDDHITFSFNLSPFSLRNQDFMDKVFTIADEEKIDTKRFIIELYERKTHHNLSAYLKTLQKIRSRGFQICIDNFGASNASMEYIKHFKFDRVQFDRDFVSRLDEQNSLSILKSLISMSKGLHITTVAKWVDNKEQKRRLIKLDVNYLQGYYIGKQLTEQQIIQQYNQ